MRSFMKRRKLVAATVVAILALGGAAFAYWTTSGTGGATATTGTSSAVTVTQVGTVSGLVPGSAAQAVDYKINNPSNGAVTTQDNGTIEFLLTFTKS